MDVDKADVSAVLAGERVFFVPEQIFDQSLTILTDRALGGMVVDHAEEATLIIDNPAHHLAQEQRPSLKKAAPKAVIQPYYYISLCLSDARRPKPEEVAPVPLMVHPDRSRSHAPLRAWISVNLAKHVDETPAQAKQVVTHALESRGALEVTKRAAADLLIVDVKSQFYKTVLNERETYGRVHQQIAERDWVETCIAENRLSWKKSITAQAEEKRAEQVDHEDEADSMIGDSPADAQRRAPGRPVGKPRIDYTPEDDDFLCRYLAVWHPSGAWLSRKTYYTMADRTSMYPIVERHTAQSWHERFKKNQNAFERRVKRFTEQGINQTLKTKAERDKAKAHADERESEQAGEAGPSTGQEGHTTAQREGARLTTQALQRQLEENQATSRTGASFVQAGPERVVVQQIVVTDPPEQPVIAPEIPPALQPSTDHAHDHLSTERPSASAPRSPASAAAHPQSPASRPGPPAGAPDEPALRPATELTRSREDANSTPLASRISGPRRSLLREELETSAHKRRRPEESPNPAARPGRSVQSGSVSHRSPQAAPEPAHDQVLASTVYTRKPTATPSSASPRVNTRPRSPPLSLAERRTKIVQGAQAVDEMYQKYKAKLLEYQAKYGKTPGEAVELIRRFSRGTSAVQWGEVDEGFRQTFGY